MFNTSDAVVASKIDQTDRAGRARGDEYGTQ
jgi:hypothetical protein